MTITMNPKALSFSDDHPEPLKLKPRFALARQAYLDAVLIALRLLEPHAANTFKLGDALYQMAERVMDAQYGSPAEALPSFLASADLMKLGGAQCMKMIRRCITQNPNAYVGELMIEVMLESLVNAGREYVADRLAEERSGVTAEEPAITEVAGTDDPFALDDDELPPF